MYCAYYNWGMKDLKFEWDEDKERANIKKHGISFSTAALVFNDEKRVEYYDADHSGEEDRFATIGLVGDIITVVYTIRKPIYRIISARAATKKEKKRYYDGY